MYRERGHRPFRIIGFVHIGIGPKGVDVVDAGNREFEHDPVGQPRDDRRQRRNRPRRYPRRFARHGAAEQITRDTPDVPPVKVGGKIDILVDLGRVAEDPVVHLPDHTFGMAIERCGQHEALLGRARPRHRQLQRLHAEQPVDIALPEVDRQRRAHEYGVEILAADQAGVLHAAIGRIHRREQARGPEKLQRIDDESERSRPENDERGGAQKPQQVLGRVAHEIMIQLDRVMISILCLSMICEQTRSRLSRESRFPLFRIML